LKGRPLVNTPGVLVVLLGLGWIAMRAADRVFTNPRPDGHLEQLFPAAVGFSDLGGNPLHFTAYGVDPRRSPAQKPLGFAFWTTDLVPLEHGYHGPIHILVGLDLTGTWRSVVKGLCRGRQPRVIGAPL
jgi:transcriptional regulator of nitric oxide reductase